MPIISASNWIFNVTKLVIEEILRHPIINRNLLCFTISIGIIILTIDLRKVEKDKNVNNNMTKGNPLKLIIQFAIPILFGNLFQQFYNLVDSVIVGQYIGVNALAAVGTTGPIVFLVYGWIGGMTSGFSVLISQSFGANDEKRIKHFEALSFFLCTIMAVIMTVGTILLSEKILTFMNTPEEIFMDTYEYIKVIYLGLVFTITYNLLAGMLRAIGDSKSPLIFLAISAFLNIILDLLFVAVIPFGVVGAAYATVISQAVSCVLCIVYIKKKYPIFRFSKEDVQFSWRSIWRLLSMGIPMGLQFSITAMGTMIVQSKLNEYGPIYIAAFSAAGKIQIIVAQPFIALGATMATFVGQNTGAGKMDRVKEGFSKSLKMGLLFSIISAVIVYFFGGTFVRIFMSDASGDVVKVASQYFHTVFWFYPFLSSIFLFRNTLQGLGDGFFPMMGGVFELIARVVAIALLEEPFGYTGICFTDPFAWVAALIPLIPVFYLRMKKYTKTMSVEQSI